MENENKIDAMEKELDKLQGQLDEYEKALRTDAAMQLSPDAPAVPVQKGAPTEVRAVLDEKSRATIRELSSQMEDLKKRLEVLEEISSKLELLDEMDEELNYIKNFMDTKLNLDFEAMYQNILEQMNVEAIKIYRNIQAVIVEEDAKQNHVLFGVDGKSDKLKSRMNHVMIFSIISFVVSILVMIMQILPALGIDIF